MLICNCTISCNNLFIIGAFESYIMQCKPISGTCILTNINGYCYEKLLKIVVCICIYGSYERMCVLLVT
jgi:hypothetical protein